MLGPVSGLAVQVTLGFRSASVSSHLSRVVGAVEGVDFAYGTVQHPGEYFALGVVVAPAEAGHESRDFFPWPFWIRR